MFKGAILCGFCLILLLSCVTNAQTCRNKEKPFQPTKCAPCSACSFYFTGASCCDVYMDYEIKRLSTFHSQKCLEKLIRYSCAKCDPQNQVYFDSQKFNMCKSDCLGLNSLCGTQYNCSTYPEANCWSAANSLNPGAAILFILSILTVMLF